MSRQGKKTRSREDSESDSDQVGQIISYLWVIGGIHFTDVLHVIVFCDHGRILSFICCKAMNCKTTNAIY